MEFTADDVARFAAILLVGLPLVGCQGPALPLAPTLFSQNAQAAFADDPPARETTEIEILYAIDRSVERAGDGEIALTFQTRKIIGDLALEFGAFWIDT